MNRGKVVSGFVALGIYLGLIFLVLYFYNIHKTKAKNYVEKNSDRVTVTLVNSDKTVFNKSAKKSNHAKPVPLVPIPLKRPKSTPKKHIPKKHTIKKHIPKKVIRPKHTPKRVIPKKVVPPKRVPKKSIPKKVVKPKPIPKKHIPKKVIPPKKVPPKKRPPKKVVPPKKVPPKKRPPKKVVPPKKVPPKKRPPKKVVPPKKVPPKKRPPKKVVPPKKVPPKKKPPKKVVPPKKVPPKKSAKDLFSSVKTKDVSKRPVKREPKPVKHRPVVTPQEPSRVKHNSSISDRIKNTHQSGRVSNVNRDRGVQNAYVAKVKRHMNNWNAGSAHKGKRVSLSLTIYSSGKFKYRILSGGDMDMKNSLSQFLDRLNRMGQLGRHSKSSPYSIRVDFTVR